MQIWVIAYSEVQGRQPGWLGGPYPLGASSRGAGPHGLWGTSLRWVESARDSGHSSLCVGRSRTLREHALQTLTVPRETGGAERPCPMSPGSVPGFPSSGSSSPSSHCLAVPGIYQFNSDEHSIYHCGKESLRGNEVATIVTKRV